MGLFGLPINRFPATRRGRRGTCGKHRASPSCRRPRASGCGNPARRPTRMYLAMSRAADREGYPEVAEAFKRYAWEEAEHASKFAELLGDCVWDTKTNLEKRMNAEAGACEDKKRIATRAKALNLDAIHDTVHEMCKDEARHGKGFEGLYNRYFGKK